VSVASAQARDLFALHLHLKVGQVQKGVFKTIGSTPSPPTPRHLFRCDCRPARPRQRLGHGTAPDAEVRHIRFWVPRWKGGHFPALLRRPWVLPHLPAWQPAPGLPMERRHPPDRSPCGSPLKELRATCAWGPRGSRRKKHRLGSRTRGSCLQPSLWTPVRVSHTCR
jgi:hypothetical protein